MCLKNTYYPLVRLKDGKKKILFKYGVDVTGRDEFENLVFETTQWKLAKLHLSKHETLNRAFQEVEDLEEFEQMIQVPCGSCAASFALYSFLSSNSCALPSFQF